MGNMIDLCGEWLFQVDPNADGVNRRYHAPGHDDASWRPVRVPFALDDCHPGLYGYEGPAWARRSFVIPAEWRRSLVRVRFEAVNPKCSVWVNGEHVADNEDGCLPFELDITSLARFGEKNTIAVLIDSTRRRGAVPGMERGWRPFGGIIRPVSVVRTPRVHLGEPRVDARPTDGGGAFAMTVRAYNETDAVKHLRFQVILYDPFGAEAEKWNESAAPVEPGQAAEWSVEGRIAGACLWSPDSPNLYRARITAMEGDAPLDAREVRFGFRSIRVADGRLLLNGEPLFLVGFNRHEDSPRSGMRPDPEMARIDLLDMKSLGANFVRLAHYPHSAQELDVCDELGFLALAEIPLYWWNGNEEGEENRACKLRTARRQITRMVARDGSHPSIIFWSVSNENIEKRPEVRAGNSELLLLVKELDPSRLAVHVSFDPAHAQFDLDDVVCLNIYPPWKTLVKVPENDFHESAEFCSSVIAGVRARYPGKPVLVTEFGCPSLGGTNGDVYGEDVQALAIETEARGMRDPGVCGITIWCYADHPWPEDAMLQGISMSPYGVVCRDRRGKRAKEIVGRTFRGFLESREGRPPADA